MRIRYTLRARADIESIFAYLDSRNPAAALAVKREIERAAAALGVLPYLGAVAERSPEFRAVIVGHYPYRIYYRIRGNEVWIVHIRHTSRRPWSGESD
jgi:plasmid stabilization system protein ParE